MSGAPGEGAFGATEGLEENEVCGVRSAAGALGDLTLDLGDDGLCLGEAVEGDFAPLILRDEMEAAIAPRA